MKILSLILLSALVMFTARAKSYLVVLTDQVTSEVLELSLDQRPVISYDNDNNLVVKAGNMTFNLPASGIKATLIDDPTSIVTIPEDMSNASRAPKVVMKEGKIVVVGVSPDNSLRVYDIYGRLVYGSQADFK